MSDHDHTQPPPYNPPRMAKVIQTSFKANDPTNPSHYNEYAIQPIDFIMQNNLPFWMANVIKYVMRADRKAGVEDLRKAQKYIEFRINQLEGRDIT